MASEDSQSLNVAMISLIATPTLSASVHRSPQREGLLDARS